MRYKPKEKNVEKEIELTDDEGELTGGKKKVNSITVLTLLN